MAVKKAAAKKKAVPRKAPAKRIPARPAARPKAAPSAKALRFSFHGNGLDFFLLKLGNHLLSLVTLGIYSAWGRAKSYRYQYGMTAFAGQRFRFSGTGKEIFRGFVIAILIFGAIYGAFFLGVFLSNLIHAPLLAFPLQIGFFVGLGYLLELAHFRSRAYRASRLSWSGVPFVLRGSAKDFAKEMLGRRVVAGISFGLLQPDYFHYRRLRIYENMRFGHLEFGYDAELAEYRDLCFKGFLLSLVTCGIYVFWWMPRLLRFHLSHITLAGRRFSFEMSDPDYIALMAVNLLIVLCSLGLAYPKAIVRYERFICERLSLAIPEAFLKVKAAAGRKVAASGEAMEDMADAGFDWGF